MPALAVQLVAPAEVNCCVFPRRMLALVGEIACGAISVTTALAEPPGPVTVTVAVPLEGIVEGAVYSPLELIVPAEALQLVPPVDVNCWVWPRIKLALLGEMTGVVTSVTVAVAVPIEPLAVIVTVAPVLGSVAGALYRPLELIVPAEALQYVAPVAANCCDPPSDTLTVEGEMLRPTNGTENAGPGSVMGFTT